MPSTRLIGPGAFIGASSYDDTTLPVDPPDWDGLCEGDADFNGFYGNGVVDALAAANL